jgi:putative restriction endonuclease
VNSADKNQRWTEEQTLLGLYLYFQLPFGKLHSKNPEIVQLAQAIGRTSGAVAMKLCNFASLDPKIIGSGRKGLAKTSHLDRDLYAKFGEDWSGLVGYAEGQWRDVVAVEHAPAPKLKDNQAEFKAYVGASTRQAMTAQRVGQSFFRRAVIANYNEACCITGIADPRLLVASHIKPWGMDSQNRHNPANGFLLSATFDKAFDRGLLTIDPDGQIMISKQLSAHRNPETRDFFSKYDGKPTRRPSRFDPDPALLEWHNRYCFADSPDAAYGLSAAYE